MKIKPKFIYIVVTVLIASLSIFTVMVHKNYIDKENQKLSNEVKKLSNEVKKLSNDNQKLTLDLKNEIMHSQKIMQENAVYKSKVSNLTEPLIDKKRSKQLSDFEKILAIAEHVSNPNVQHKQSAVEKSSVNIGEGNREQTEKAFKGPEKDFYKNLNSSNKKN